MLSLSDREWKSFRLLDYFKPDKGNQKNMASLKPGDIPLVSARKINNGLKDFVSMDCENDLFSGYCLTINNDGDGGAGIAYYQPFNFLLDTHVTALNPKTQISKWTMLFIASSITHQREKFGHGYSINTPRLETFRIMLPVSSKGNPDFAFMEQYIREREQRVIQNYTDSIVSLTASLQEIEPLDQKEWRPFLADDLFTFDPGKGKGANHLTEDENGISYLGATNRNNGVLRFVTPVPELVQKGNCIAFIRNGEGSMGFSVYKREDFIATSDITVGYAPFLNQYTGFFITTVADKVRGKYNFNYKRSDTRLKKEFLQLPIDNNGLPDWQYMEQYTKNLFIKLKLQYLQEKALEF